MIWQKLLDGFFRHTTQSFIELQSILSFVLGCILSLFFWNKPAFFYFILVWLVLFIALRSKWVVGLAFVIGLLWPVLHYHIRYPTYILNDYFSQSVDLKGVVTNVSNGIFNNKIITVKVCQLNERKLLVLSRLKVEVAIDKDILIKRGDEITARITLSAKRFRQNSNHESRILRSFLKGELYRGKLVENSELIISETNANELAKNISASNYAWLFESLFTGNKDTMPMEFKEQIKQLGIGHLFAISGLHMGIVFGFSFLIFKVCAIPLFRSQLIDYSVYGVLFALGICALYLYSCNFAVSATRAFIMLAVFCGNYLRLNKLLSWHSLGWALAGVLLIDPFSLLDVGLYFSFAAVAALFCAFSIATTLKVTNYVLLLLLAQLSIGLFITPLSVYFFNGLSGVSVFVNLIVIPLFTFVFVPTLILCAICLLFFGQSVSKAVDGVLASFIDMLGVAPVQDAWLNASLSSDLIAGILLAVLLLYMPFKLKFLGVVPLAILAIDHQMSERPLAELTVFDVGHGNAIALKQDNWVLLYDLGSRFGNYSYTQSIILPYLQRNNIEYLDVIVSHDDSDHKGDISVLLDNAFNTNVLANGNKGEVCDIGFTRGNISVNSVWPKDPQATDNNNSCVVTVSIEGMTLLLTGDIEKPVEPQVINQLKAHKYDFVVSPHHGSNSSSSDDFIVATKPSWVIHSARRYDHWKLPNINTVERYAKHGVNQVSTQNGAILIRFYKDKYTITQQNTLQSYWFLYI